MKKDQVSKKLRALAESLGDEASTLPCEACQEYLPMLVDAEMEGEQVSSRFPALWNHLLACETCSKLYADLLEAAMMDEAGELPVPARIPVPDLSFLPSPEKAADREQIIPMAKEILEQIAPRSLSELGSAVKTFFDHIVSRGGEGVRLPAVPDLALGFGTETTPALAFLAATYSTTQYVLKELEPESWPLSLTGKEEKKLQRAARTEGQRMGLDRTDAKAFARIYVEVVQGRHPTDSNDQEE